MVVMKAWKGINVKKTAEKNETYEAKAKARYEEQRREFLGKNEEYERIQRVRRLTYYAFGEIDSDKRPGYI